MTAWPVSGEVERGLIEVSSRNINFCAKDNQEKHDHDDGYAGRDSN